MYFPPGRHCSRPFSRGRRPCDRACVDPALQMTGHGVGEKVGKCTGIYRASFCTSLRSGHRQLTFFPERVRATSLRLLPAFLQTLRASEDFQNTRSCSVAPLRFNWIQVLSELSKSTSWDLDRISFNSSGPKLRYDSNKVENCNCRMLHISNRKMLQFI